MGLPEGLLSAAPRIEQRPGRLRLKSFVDLREHLARLPQRRDLETDAAWTAGQIVFHLAAVVEYSSAKRMPVRRRRSRLLMTPIRVFVLWRGLPRAYPIPAEVREVFVPPDSAELTSQCSRLLRAMDVFETVTHDMPDHPALGRLTLREWRLFHLRHCELHLGHIVPEATVNQSAR